MRAFSSMDAFVGREHELAKLDRALEGVRRTGRGGFISMRGRRRVGKSRLVEEFAQRSGCPYLFYTAVKEEGESELGRFLEALAQSELPAAAQRRAGADASTWEAAFDLAVRDATRESPLILIVDEFPYLAEKSPTIEAVMQLIWDHTVQRVPVLLVLIGSDRATMEALSAEGRPLYDRPREFVVEPLTPADISEMLGLDPREAFDAYLVTGGFPVLALEWQSLGGTREAYLAEALTDESSFLVLSAERTLAAEFDGDARARAVLGAIGSDARAHNEIGTRTGLNATSLHRALDVLQAKGVVDRFTAYSAKPSRNTQYVVADSYLRFCLRFVARDLPLIQRGRGSLLVDRVSQSWTTYRGRAIEPVVRTAIEKMLPDERFGPALHVGSFWTRNASVEVDLVGGDKQPVAGNVAFLGSVKWRESAAFTRTDLTELAAHRTAVRGTSDATRLVGVSRAGFLDAGGLDLQLGPEELIAAFR